MPLTKGYLTFFCMVADVDSNMVRLKSYYLGFTAGFKNGLGERSLKNLESEKNYPLCWLKLEYDLTEIQAHGGVS